MNKSGDFILALAANFIVAGIVAALGGTGPGAISFSIGLLLVFVWLFFFRKTKPEIPVPPPPTSLRIENNPNISPSFSQSFNPTIQIGASGTAPALSTLPESRPKLTFDRWDTKAEHLDSWESGFVLSNHGQAALDVQVQRFQVAAGQFASSKAIATLPAHSRQGFAPVWLEGYSPFGFVAEKWDLFESHESGVGCANRKSDVQT